MWGFPAAHVHKRICGRACACAQKLLHLHAHTCTQNTGTSLLETFDLDQLRAHVERVREEVARLAGKSGGGSGSAAAATAAAAAAAAAAAHADPKDVCTVCQQSKFSFEPPCIYCTQCGQRIRRGQTYYGTPPVRLRVAGVGLWRAACSLLAGSALVHAACRWIAIAWGAGTLIRPVMVKPPAQAAACPVPWCGGYLHPPARLLAPACRCRSTAARTAPGRAWTQFEALPLPPQEYEIKGFWCHSCYSEHKGDRVPFDGSQARGAAWAGNGGEGAGQLRRGSCGKAQLVLYVMQA